MFRDIKRPIVLVLVLYAIVGTMDFADQVAREKIASTIAVAASNNHSTTEE